MSAHRFIIALLLGGLWLPSARTAAQSVDLRQPSAASVELAEVRRGVLEARRTAGLALMIGGLASVVGGAVAAGVGADDPGWLTFGIGTAGWGAVNAGLSLGLLDLGGGRAEEIENDLSLRGQELARVRQESAGGRRSAASLFAFNTGLDVFYMGTAVMLLVLADTMTDATDAGYMRGYAWAQLTQGAFLFAFDLSEWIASLNQVSSLEAVELPGW